MRLAVLTLAALVASASSAHASDTLRHVEYDVVTIADGARTHEHLALDLLVARGEDGSVVAVSDRDDARPVRVVLDHSGIVRANANLTDEAALLCRFFALGASNLTAMDRNDEWDVDGTRYRVLRSDGKGHLDMSFMRNDYVGRLTYDAAKVIPVRFDTRGSGGYPGGVMHDVRYIATLTADSQP